MEPMVLLILASGGLSAGILAYLAMEAREQGEVVRAGTSREQRRESSLIRLVLPIARAIAPLHAGAGDTPRGRDLERLLKRAGRPFGLRVPELLSLRYVAAAFGAILGFLLSQQLVGETDFVFLFAFAAMGFFYPTMSLGGVAARRQRRVFRDMPYILDLLTLSTEAGQDFSSAMATVVEKGPPGPLVEEFRIAHQEVTLGTTRSDSLRGMADRIDLQELTSFVLALLQAEQLGTSVGKVLRTMADQMRVKRSTLAEELAGKVPVKLMLPLVACIFPASFIVLFVPLFLEYQAKGGF